MLPTDSKPEVGPAGRVCRACKKWKSWSEFHKKGNGLFGRHSQCGPCSIKKMQQRRKRKVPVSDNVIDVINCYWIEHKVRDDKMNGDFKKLISNLVYDSVFNDTGEKNE